MDSGRPEGTSRGVVSRPSEPVRATATLCPDGRSSGRGIWCWDPMARKGCVPCEKKRLKLRLSDMPHTCGYIMPLAPLVRDTALRRREEAVAHKECFHCHGAGFVYEYNAPKYKRTVSVIGDYAITDN